jgi:anaerobic magnesium-protoporphyrin IX monomethyl ester cyclase
MKVVLVNPPLETSSRAWFPLGIGYLASYLRKYGYEVEVVDCIGNAITRKDFIEIVKKANASCFGVGGIITAYNNVSDIVGYIRENVPDAFIFAGNTVAYSIPELILKHTAVDAVVCGEGEITILELMQAYQAGKGLRAVKGIIYKEPSGEIYANPVREGIQDIDSLPLPAWDLLPLENYFANIGHRYCLISSVRGCPYNCIYCCRTFMGYKIRYRSAQSIVNELLEFHKRYNITQFYFFDDLSTVNKDRMLEFCRLKMETVLAAMPWTIAARVNLVDDELIKALKEAKCAGVGFGLESMDQGILNEIGKNIKIEQIEQAIALCEKYGLGYSGSSFMIGSPSETEETVKKSSDFCKKHNLRYEPHFITPFPGTKLYEDTLKNGLIKDELEYIRRIAKQGHTNCLAVNVTKNLSDAQLNELYTKYKYFPKPPLGVYAAKFFTRPWKYLEMAFTDPKKLLRLAKDGADYSYTYNPKDRNECE